MEAPPQQHYYEEQHGEHGPVEYGEHGGYGDAGQGPGGRLGLTLNRGRRAGGVSSRDIAMDPFGECQGYGFKTSGLFDTCSTHAQDDATQAETVGQIDAMVGIDFLWGSLAS